MEQIKKRALELAKKLGKAGLSIARTSAKATADLMGRAAGHAVKFVRDKGGALVKSAGGKVKTGAREHRQGLLIAAAVVSGLALAASLLGLLLGRKK